jgi:hypothetical protein
VVAEPGDDISSLELPQEDSPAPKQQEAKPEAKPESSPVPKEERTGAATPDTAQAKATSTGEGKPQKQKYPLYPSVQHLLRVNGLPKEEADKIPASGPNGRLLKGDVLAYLGKVQESYPADQSKRISKLAHLDLSNIKLAAPKTPEVKKPIEAPKPQPIVQQDTEIAVTISFKAVQELQQRLKDSLGTSPPLSTFIARASELANYDLPRSQVAKPSADELFDAVLGIEKKYSRGHFVPQIKTSFTAPRPSKRPDIFDELVGKKTATSTVVPTSVGVVGPVNVFSVSVPKGDERRAQVFLERVKGALEVEPGVLVL